MLPNRSNMFAKLHDRDTARRAGALRPKQSLAASRGLG